MIKPNQKFTKVRCIRPFTSVELQPRGEVSFCCAEWAKVPYIGNLKNQSLAQVWNSDTAQYFRRKMLAGEYEEVCRSDVCPVLISEGYKELCLEHNADSIYPLTRQHIDDISAGRTFMTAMPTYVLMSNLEACNLKCPICGPYRQIYIDHENNDPMREAAARQKWLMENEDSLIAERVAEELISNASSPKVLGLSGAGDPFFRSDAKKILFADNKPSDMRIALFTNGLLFNIKMWKRIRHNSFKYVNVSVDAARAETYEKLRRPGKWKTLVKNLSFIGQLRKDGLIPKFVVNFTVMKSNLEEIIPFIKLGCEWGCDDVYFQRVRGVIWKKENFFDGPDADPVLLERLKQIKKDAKKTPAPGCKVGFGNL